MRAKKTRPRRGVKRRLTKEDLDRLRARLAAAEVSFELVDSGWYSALDSDLDLPHPVHARVDAGIDAHPKLGPQRREARDLASAFGTALPKRLRATWLEVDRLRNELTLVEIVATYDLGVADGRRSVVVESKLRDAGIDTLAIEPPTLFLLTSLLVEIARRLPLVEVAT